jgi:hypothetical protein
MFLAGVYAGHKSPTSMYEIPSSEISAVMKEGKGDAIFWLWEEAGS